MPNIVTVESLKAGDRFEFVASRSEWADNCYLTHPKGIIVVAKNPFVDGYKQCRFEWRPEKFPKGRSQDWWGVPQTKVRLLGPAPNPPADHESTSVKGKSMKSKTATYKAPTGKTTLVKTPSGKSATNKTTTSKTVLQ